MKLTIIAKTNGCDLKEEVANLTEKFHSAVKNLFNEDVTSDEFYYGENLNMIRLRIGKEYGDFNITRNRISYCGCTCSFEHNDMFGMLTLNDELYDGQLEKLAM